MTTLLNNAINISKTALEAIEWLKNEVPGFNKGRMIRYKRTASRLIEQNEAKPITLVDLFSLYDIENLVRIYELREELSKMADFKMCLREMIGGREVAHFDINRSARNHQFQLEAGVFVHNSGCRLVEHTTGDVEATTHGVRIIGECKRVSSNKLLEANVREAEEQVSARQLGFQSSVGAIFVDVTPLTMQSPEFWRGSAEFWNVGSEQEARDHHALLKHELRELLGARLYHSLQNPTISGTYCHACITYDVAAQGLLFFNTWFGIANWRTTRSAQQVFNWLSDAQTASNEKRGSGLGM